MLGTGPLTPGRYTMVRLEVTSAALYFDNAAAGPACAATVATPAGRSAPVEVPSGVVRLNREFELTSTSATTILLRSTSIGRQRPFHDDAGVGVVSVPVDVDVTGHGQSPCRRPTTR